LATTIHVSVVDAETDDFIHLILSNGDDVFFSVLVAPVKAQLPGEVILTSIDALAGEPANGPIGIDGPADKAVTGVAGAGALFNELTGTPRIYKVDGSLQLQLDPTSDTAGWYIIAVPQEVDAWDLQPAFIFVKNVSGAANAPFTLYSKTLSALAREVLELRVATKAYYEPMVAQWGGQPSEAVWQSTFGYIWNLPGHPKDERLVQLWPDVIWAIFDPNVPAREFDLLVERWLQMRAVLATVPWPVILYFERCATSLPLTVDKNGDPLAVGDYHLFLPSFSTYFPRSDKQIATDLGMLWLANFGPIVLCVINKIAERIEDAKDTAKFWKIVSYVAPLLMFPNPLTIVTTIWQGVQDVYLTDYCAKAENKSKTICDAEFMALVNMAINFIIGLAAGGASVSAIDLGGKAYQFIVDQVKVKLAEIGAQELEELKDSINPDDINQLVMAILGLDTFPKDLEPFLIWCLRVTTVDTLIADILNAILGEDKVDPKVNISQNLLNDAAAAGVPIPAGLQDLVDNGAYSSTSYVVPVVVGGSILAGGGLLTYLALAGKL
jgi:hypothetical protein